MGQIEDNRIEAPKGTDIPISTPSLRYCLYARKSTESDEKQAMSIDSQIKEMLRIAQRNTLKVVEIKREAHSAKDTGQRPVFNQMLNEIREGKFNAIITWAPDRLSRNAGDLGALVDLMDQKILQEIRTYGQKFSNSPNEKFLLMILCSQAKLENDQKGINVKRGLRAKCEMGLWPAPAPTGYLNENRTDRKGHVLVDPIRAPIIKQMFEKVANEQYSGRKLHRWLREIDFKTKNGKPLWLSTINKILNTSFYCGTFEYPRGSGNWYTGVHKAIISRELFEKVQQKISTEREVKYAVKEFAFTRLMKCGLCGSGVTAEEKFKKLKNGGTNRHVYYGCTRARDLQCKCGYLREQDLILQLIQIIDEINLDELGVRKKLKEEVTRYYKFQQGVLGVEKDNIKTIDVDIRNYAKYILREGNVIEKRELLSYLKDKLILKNKQVTLKK